MFGIENICAQKRTEISSLNQVSESKEIRSIRFIYFSGKEELNLGSHCHIKITKSLSEKGGLSSSCALKESSSYHCMLSYQYVLGTLADHTSQRRKAVGA